MTPASPSPEQQQQQAPDSAPADLFDFTELKNYLFFALGAPRRHPLLAGSLFVLVLGCALGALWALPKTYHARTTILAQRNQVIASLGNPRRTVPGDSDAPTRAASETVRRRDNLLAIIKDTRLVEQWDATRAPLLRLKDHLMALVAGPMSEEDKVEALVGLLERRLNVGTADGTVTIMADWPDAQLAHRIVESAQENFLETRHALEVSAIAEAISILEGHATGVQERINSALEAIRSDQEAKDAETRAARENRPVPVRRPRVAPPPTPSAEDRELAQLRSLLTAKRRAIADLEQFRQRRLSELEAQLAQQKTVYAPAHPVILTTEESIESLSRDSLQIEELKREEAQLLAEYEKRGGKEAEARPRASLSAPVLQPEPMAEVRRVAAERRDDPMDEYSRTRLRMDLNKYDEYLGRIDAARIELDTARAAFKYRYSVIKPSQVPKKPVKPNPALLVVAGVVGGLFLALFASVAADVWGGRILATWQLERVLKLRVLAEVSGK